MVPGPTTTAPPARVLGRYGLPVAWLPWLHQKSRVGGGFWAMGKKDVGSRQRRDTKLAWGKTAAVSELLCQSQTREMRVADARFWAGLG